MDKEKHPGINFENIILSELNFYRKPEIIQKPDLELKFENLVSLSPEKNKLSYYLKCEINDKNDSIKILCSIIGIFSVDKNNQNMDIEYFAENYAPALLLPYVRETVSSVTLKAGIPPILLPPLNIHAMLKKEESK